MASQERKELGADKFTKVPDAVQERLQGVLEKGEFVTWCHPTDRKVWWALHLGCLVSFILAFMIPVLALLLRNALTAGVASRLGIVGLCIGGLVYVVVWRCWTRDARKLAKGTAYVITNRRAILLGSCLLHGRRRVIGLENMSLLPAELKQRVVEPLVGSRGSIIFWRRVENIKDMWREGGFLNIPDVWVVDNLLAALANLASDCDGPDREETDRKWCEFAGLDIRDFYTTSEEVKYKCVERKYTWMINYPWLKCGLICIVLVGVLVTFAYKGTKIIPEYLACWRLRDAVIVPAKVLSVDLDEDQELKRVLYSYDVKGLSYTNDRLGSFARVGPPQYDLPCPVICKLRKVHKGDVIEAFVGHHDPRMSVLDRTITAERILVDLFGTLTLMMAGAISVYCLLLVVSRIRQQR
jgi:hypothetical protein